MPAHQPVGKVLDNKLGPIRAQLELDRKHHRVHGQHCQSECCDQEQQKSNGDGVDVHLPKTMDNPRYRVCPGSVE